MEERRIEKTNEEPRFSDVLAREGGEEKAEPRGDRDAIAHDVVDRCGDDGENEVHVRLIIHRPRNPGAAGCDSYEPAVALEERYGSVCELRVKDRDASWAHFRAR